MASGLLASTNITRKQRTNEIPPPVVAVIRFVDRSVQSKGGRASNLDEVRSGDALLVKKAVITAAARTQRALPLQTLIDGDSNEKSLLRILIEQSLPAGIEEIAVVVCPGDEAPYAQSAGPYASSVRFIPQHEPRGYGHAIHCARSF